MRQLYVYHDFYKASRVALVYPGDLKSISGQFYHPDQNMLTEKVCSVLQIPSHADFDQWKGEILERVKQFLAVVTTA